MQCLVFQPLLNNAKQISCTTTSVHAHRYSCSRQIKKPPWRFFYLLLCCCIAASDLNLASQLEINADIETYRARWQVLCLPQAIGIHGAGLDFIVADITDKEIGIPVGFSA